MMTTQGHRLPGKFSWLYHFEMSNAVQNTAPSYSGPSSTASATAETGARFNKGVQSAMSGFKLTSNQKDVTLMPANLSGSNLLAGRLRTRYRLLVLYGNTFRNSASSLEPTVDER